MRIKTYLSWIALSFIFLAMVMGSSIKADNEGAAKIPEDPLITEGPGVSPDFTVTFLAGEALGSIELQAQSKALIEFQTQNGVTIQGKPARTKLLPHLVLFRNGSLTDRQERTLRLTLNGLKVTTPGVRLTIRIETQHPDPDAWKTGRTVIPVWETTRVFESPPTSEPITISHTFEAKSKADNRVFLTPTDYYRLRIILADTQHPVENPLFTQVEDFAFLLESQWEFDLPDVNEEAQGAAPGELVLYYCDMFPYQIDYLDSGSRLTRQEVESFVHDELGPAMVEAYSKQSTQWGFEWYSTWNSYRSGVDAERLSVAMTLPGVWYHGRAPASAHSGISINTTHKDYSRYDRLVHGMISAFHHELFHNIQRNINLELGGDGDIDGEGDSWAVITEGMATMASSVGQPEVEFVAEGSYLTQANTFLSGGKFYEPDLNTSYGDLDPYRASIYWRFLYEQCGGLEDGEENPAAGMQVMRQTLETLYSTGILDGDSIEMAEFLPVLMDRVLEQTAVCPFSSYRQSLAQFSRSIYALRFDRQCMIDEAKTRCGLYDPQSQYADPPVESVTVKNDGNAISGSIPSSYGMDFIEVQWRSEDSNPHFEVEFSNLSDAAEFNVQLLWIDELEPGLVPGEKGLPEWQVIEGADTTGHGRYGFEVGGAQAGERMAVIITRMDGNEIVDPVGEYAISLR